MLKELLERVPIDSLNPIKGCNQGPKDACDYIDIAMDEADKFLVDFNVNDPKLDICGRYRDDTFILWLHGIDKICLILSKHYLNSSNLSIQILILPWFMICKEIRFLDICRERIFKDKNFF